MGYDNLLNQQSSSAVDYPISLKFGVVVQYAFSSRVVEINLWSKPRWGIIPKLELVKKIAIRAVTKVKKDWRDGGLRWQCIA